MAWWVIVTKTHRKNGLAKSCTISRMSLSSARGVGLYLQFGSGDASKGHIVLSQYSIFQRADTFARFHCQNELGVRRTLLKMHRTGRYSPDTKWIIKGAGNGMNVKRAEAAWRLMREPASATQTDVNNVYFDFLQYQAQRDYEACHSDFEESDSCSSD